MKKLLLFFLIISISLSFCACGDQTSSPVAKEVKDYRFTLDALQNAFCDDNRKFSVSGTTATTQDWAYSNYYGRVISAEIAEEYKITSVKMEYTDLDTGAYKSPEALSKFLKDDGSISAWDYLTLVPLYDLRDLMTLVGAKDSEITEKQISNLVEKGTSFEKNNWTICVNVGDSSVTFTAEYSAAVG